MDEEFVYLEEHTADVAFIAYGNSFDEAFANAAKAMFNVMTDINKVEPVKCMEVEVEDEDLQGLLKKWLEELLFIFDSEGIVFSHFKVHIDRRNKYYLHGKACGEHFNVNKHSSGIEVKAVSYHWMKIGEEKGKKFVRVVLDI